MHAFVEVRPEGGALAGDGRHGSTIPKPGRVRSRNDVRAYWEPPIKESSLPNFLAPAVPVSAVPIASTPIAPAPIAGCVVIVPGPHHWG